MPSTSKKQHRFMEAVAHNPAFAKKAGVPQSVGKDFSAADKGRKFQKGGATMMGKKVPNAMADMMARRRMGSGMAPPAPPVMPPQPSAPMGMKKGGNVKRYAEGGDEGIEGVEGRTNEQVNQNLNTAIKDSTTFGEAFKAARKDGDKTFMWRGTNYSTALEKPKASQATVRKSEPPSPPAARLQRPSFKADVSKTMEQKYLGMKKGGMAGYSKGGNINPKGATSGSSRAGENTKIQKKGLTEGKMIKMAAGGSVGSASRRADGIAQRGKTKFTNY